LSFESKSLEIKKRLEYKLAVNSSLKQQKNIFKKEFSRGYEKGEMKQHFQNIQMKAMI
jgi:hypothetical protein